MIGTEDSFYTYEYQDHFKILPSINDWSCDKKRIGIGVKVPHDFVYSSDNNTEWMEIETLKKWIKVNIEKIGKI
jgi:hypothetical protein